MNAEVVPAALALCGGAGLLSAITAYERRREAEMRASRVPQAMRLPQDLSTDAAVAALRSLIGLEQHNEILFELAAHHDRIQHRIATPASVRPGLEASMRAAIPGLRFEKQPRSGDAMATAVMKVVIPTPSVFDTGDPDRASSALLAAMDGLHPGEQLVLRWAVRPGRPRPWQSASREDDVRNMRTAWNKKIHEPGVRAHGIILARTNSVGRARTLVAQVGRALQARSSRGRLRLISERSGRRFDSAPRVTRSSGWLSLAEILPMIGWPLGDAVPEAVQIGGAREIPVPRSVATRGRVLFLGRDARGLDRLVALTATAARHHMVVVGPSGSGKTVMTGRSILDGIAGGFGGAAFDPKAPDLVDDVLNRVRPEDADRVVVLDPSDTRPVPGVDVLGVGDPDLRSDVLVGALAAIYRDNFGIRSATYLRLGLRTLAETPGATIADLVPLFFDPGFRASAVGRLSDPVLRGQWQAFEVLSAAAQADHVQAPMAKVTELISRPAVRAVLAPPKATLDIGQLLAERKFLLVALSPGQLGEPAAKLLGAVLLYAVWAAIEARAALPAERRHPVFLYLDELSTIATLPIGLEPLLERSRGLGVGVSVALQSLARVPESVRAALLGNAATLITFRAGADEAKRLSRELPGITERDIQALGRFEVAARVGTGAGSGVATVTGRALPWPQSTGLAAHIRDLSSERYGVAREEQSAPSNDGHETPAVGRTRRRS